MSSPASASLDTHSRLCASLSTQLPRGSVSVTPLSQPVCVVRHSPAAAVPALAAALTDAAACLSGTLVSGTAAACRLTNCLAVSLSRSSLALSPLSHAPLAHSLLALSLVSCVPISLSPYLRFGDAPSELSALRSAFFGTNSENRLLLPHSFLSHILPSLALSPGVLSPRSLSFACTCSFLSLSFSLFHATVLTVRDRFPLNVSAQHSIIVPDSGATCNSLYFLSLHSHSFPGASLSTLLPHSRPTLAAGSVSLHAAPSLPHSHLS